LGPAQPAFLPDDPLAGEALQVRCGNALARPAQGHARSDPVRVRRGKDRVPIPRRRPLRFRAQTQVRRRDPEPRTSLEGNRIPDGARGTRAFHFRAAVSGVQRRTPEPFRAQRVRGGKEPPVADLALPGWRGEIAAKIVKEIRDRLRFLIVVGLDYLTLDRKADSLSGGEA